MKILLCAAFLVICSHAHADSYKVLLTDGSAKTFATKPEAVRYILLNDKGIKEIQETRTVTLTEKLSFKKAKGS